MAPTQMGGHKEGLSWSKGAAAAGMQVFCFHHAGGSPRTFAPWMRADLPVEFVPAPIRTCVPSDDGAVFARTVDGLTAFVCEHMDGRPYALFGHSMGSVFAFEVCGRLERMDVPNPVRLVVAGRHAPHRTDPVGFRSWMGLDALRDELRRAGGTPSELLEDEGFTSYLLPLVMDDYCLHEAYRYEGTRVNTPVTAHAGTNDPDANPREMAHWREVCDGAFDLAEYGGGHFFVHDLGRPYLEDLVQTVGA